MRRAGGLWDTFVAPENFRLAFWRAARSKWHRAEVRHMSQTLDTHVRAMIAAVQKGTFPLGLYRRFTVFDPKERTIHAAPFPERVLHHAIMNLLDRVIDSYATSPGRGLPIGSLTSQHFANFYLGRLDRWATETAGCLGYVRYMDDVVCWERTPDRLRVIASDARALLADELGLACKADPFMAPASVGMPFLGYRVFPSGLRLDRRSRRRFGHRLASYSRERDEGRWTERSLHDHVLPLLAFTQKAAATAFRRRTLARLGMTAVRSEPGEPRRLVEQHRQELPVGEPQQERAG